MVRFIRTTAVFFFVLCVSGCCGGSEELYNSDPPSSIQQPIQPELPPQPPPEPIHLSGVGDSVVEIDLGGRSGTAHFVSNTPNRNFVVRRHGGRLSGMSVVNEIGPYNGTVMLREGTHTLEINATGSWTVVIRPRGR